MEPVAGSRRPDAKNGIVPASEAGSAINSESSPPADAPPRDLGPWRCAADPSVETYLRCGRCDTPICPRCLVQTPVGSRCRTCGQVRRLPMFVLGPADYLKAIGAAVVMGTIGAVCLTLLLEEMRFAGIFRLLLMAGLGYLVGESVARFTNRKRGNALGVIAALGVAAGLVIGRAALLMVSGLPPAAAFLTASVLLVVPLWSALTLLVAAAVAFSRAR